MPRFLRALAPYGATLGILALATAMVAALLHTALPREIYNPLFLLIILGSAWWGGYGPGVFSILLTFLAVPFAIAPGYSLAKVNYTSLGLICMISLLVSRVASGRREREALLRESNELLDERVRRRTAELERANAELQEREALLLRQADELARSNADLQQFAYVASHDLQEPLRMIAIYTELLKRRYSGRLDSEADGFVTVILDGVRRMETLIRDLLSYSRVIHAEVPAGGEQIDAAEPLKIAVANLEAAIRETGASIHWNGLPLIQAERLELTQIFQNLLGNSLKYRSESRPQIEVSAVEDANGWTFCVRDNGIGIHPDYHEAIFSPFKRLHGREYPGTGIGLALCRRIVERQGGKIWVESEPGRGAAFYFTVAQQKRRAAQVSAISEYSSGR